MTELLGLAPDAVSARGVLGALDTQPGFHEGDRQASSGLDAIVRELATSLPHAPRLRAPVTAIRRGKGDLAVLIDESDSPDTAVRARRVIVAAPPTVSRRIAIDFQPNAIREALDAWTPGAMVKVTLVFDRRFWRDAPASPGTIVAVDVPGVTVRDVSHPGESLGGRRAMGGSSVVGRRLQLVDPRGGRRRGTCRAA